MLSFQIKEEINKILASFEEAQYFFNCLENINSTALDLEKYIQVIAKGASDQAANANQLRSHLTQTRQKIGQIKPRSFFSSIEKLQFEINKAKEFDFNDLSQLDEIDNKLNNFSHAYEEYLESYSPESAGLMVLEGKSIYYLL